MIDHVARQHDPEARFVNEIAHHKVVRKVFADRSISADFPDGILTQGDGRSQTEFHAFQKIGDQDSGGEFNGHPNGVESAPDSSRALAAKYTGHGSNLRIKQWSDHVAQIIRPDFDIAVAGDQDVVSSNLGQTMEAIVWGVRPGRLPGDQYPAGDGRVARGNPPDDWQSLVVRLIGGKQDFVLGVVLPKKALDILLYSRLIAVHGL